MTDFAAARRMMVDGQVRTADVTDPRLIAAMLELPRERFFPEDKMALAYLDLDIAVSEPGRPVRRLLKPMVLAKLIQVAGVGEGERALDVGCATGYSTAVLARLAGSVIGLEQDATLARQAADALNASDVSNARIVTGTLAEGCPAEGPFDVILLQGATEVPPQAVLAQLADGGRLVCVLGEGPVGKGMIYSNSGGRISGRAVFDATAAPLPGFAKPREFAF